MGIVNKTVKNGENLWKYSFMVTDAHNKATLLPKVAYIGQSQLFQKTCLKGNGILLSLGQILKQTILAAVFFDFFLPDIFLFDAN